VSTPLSLEVSVMQIDEAVNPWIEGTGAAAEISGGAGGPHLHLALLRKSSGPGPSRLQVLAPSVSVRQYWPVLVLPETTTRFAASPVS
jgi:hypothetical protein